MSAAWCCWACGFVGNALCVVHKPTGLAGRRADSGGFRDDTSGFSVWIETGDAAGPVEDDEASVGILVDPHGGADGRHAQTPFALARRRERRGRWATGVLRVPNSPVSSPTHEPSTTAASQTAERRAASGKITREQLACGARPCSFASLPRAATWPSAPAQTKACEAHHLPQLR
jgi:hypothetical protein